VRSHQHRLVQWIRLEDLLSPAVAALIFAAHPDDTGPQVYP